MVSSRSRGENLIKNGKVLVNGNIIHKTGFLLNNNDHVQLIEKELKYVSKGALKLNRAIQHWNIKIENLVFIDLGASTGGFTEVLLENNVSKVYAVDVGHNQLHDRIRCNNRVINLEKTHVKNLTSKLIPEQADGLVIDVSFISCKKVISLVQPFLKTKSTILLLIKPQFELGKEALNKHGVVKDLKLYDPLLKSIQTHFENLGHNFIGIIDSPILGGDGNKEFLAYFCAR